MNLVGTKDKRAIKIVESIETSKFIDKKALVIGINSYPTMPLEVAVNDANAVTQRLNELNFEVKTLLDDEATIENIRHELGSELAKTNINGQVLIYFAGHGVTENLFNNIEGYILPGDTNLRKLYATAISMKELRALSSRIPARHILYIFDCCYSGLGLARLIPVNFSNAQDYHSYIKRISGNRAVYMITAGSENEVAREIYGHGLFTLNFLDGIAGAADNNPKDGIVQASELGNYLSSKVSYDSNNSQNPQHGLLEGKGDFIFQLMDDDPRRLRQSLLNTLNNCETELIRRKSIQDDLDEIIIDIKNTKKASIDEYEKKIQELELKIKKKEREISKLESAFSDRLNINTSKKSYSVIKFLITSKELDILKIFKNQIELTQYYNKIFNHSQALYYKNTPCKRYHNCLADEFACGFSNIEVDSIMSNLNNANKYKTKINSNPTLSPNCEVSFSFLFNQKDNLINKITMETFVINLVFGNSISYIETSLKTDTRAFVKFIVFQISNIHDNSKLLTFDMVQNRLFAKYGKPTSYGIHIKPYNWKFDSYDDRRELIWENKTVRLIFSSVNYMTHYNRYLRESNFTEFKSNVAHYGNAKSSHLYLYLRNKSTIRNKVFKQASKIFEAEELILLKQRIEKMAEIERNRTKAASKINF